MESVLKHRLIGAAVLSAIAIIFLPKLIVGKDPDQIVAQVPLKAPVAPKGQFDTQELPLDAPASNVPAGGVVGMNASHPATAPAASVASSAASDAIAPPAAAASPASPAAPMVASPAKPVAATSPVASGKTPPAVSVAASAASPVASPAASLATETAAIPAAQSGGHYVVSLGTYSNAGNAHALVASLKGKGLPAYADAVSMAGGKPGTRVRIGPFQQRGDAEAARLRAQQIRSDMPANVVALDAATPAAEVPAPAPAASAKVSPAPPNKPPAVASGKNSPASPASDKITPPSPAAAGRGYAVQVSAYAVEADANALRDKLHAAGFVAFVQKIHAESGTRWRVRVGPEADKAAAARLRSELSTKMNLSGMVVEYP